MNIQKRAVLLGSAIVAGAVTAPAYAVVDYSGMTNAFAPDDIVSGVLAIGAVLATIYVAVKGIKLVLSMMKGG